MCANTSCLIVLRELDTYRSYSVIRNHISPLQVYTAYIAIQDKTPGHKIIASYLSQVMLVYQLAI